MAWGGPEKTEQFERNRVPPPQYHLESSRGDVKDRLTSYQLQSYLSYTYINIAQSQDNTTIIITTKMEC